MLRVQRKPCATCIYRADSPLDLKNLEDAIRDRRMAGHFVGSRTCHHSTDAVCHGFWSRHKDHYDAGQIAQRLGLVELVDDDILKEQTDGNRANGRRRRSRISAKRKA